MESIDENNEKIKQPELSYGIWQVSLVKMDLIMKERM